MILSDYSTAVFDSTRVYIFHLPKYTESIRVYLHLKALLLYIEIFRLFDSIYIGQCSNLPSSLRRALAHR